MEVTIITIYEKKEITNLKENKESYVEGFGGKKGKREMS